MINNKKKLENIIKPKLLPKLKVKKNQIPNFLSKFDKNNQHQANIWTEKTYKVDPEKHIFTTIQERFGNKLLRNLKLPQNTVAIDIGCFIGEKLWQLKNNQSYLGVGIDIAVPVLKTASQIDKYNHRYIAADMENLPFKDESVDLCLAFDVIEHLSHQQKGFSEVARVIKPGGKLLLHIPIKDNKYSFFWWKQRFFSKAAKKDYLDVGHTPEKMLTSKQIKKYLKSHGFIIEKEIYYNSFFVHFWDREFFKLLALLSVKLFRSGKTTVNKKRTTHTDGLGKIRSLYGKYVIPVLEFVSLPDWILSKLKIGNTYFCICTKINTQFTYYEKNKSYSVFLDQSKPEDFQLYIDEVLNLSKKIHRRSKDVSFLDVGCGTGVPVNEIYSHGIDSTGIDISKTSIAIAKKKKGKFYTYDGGKLPFKANSFDTVGSSNVIEHVEDVTMFLDESLRVLKHGGYLIICAPNFLSLTSSYHYRTSGLKMKTLNFLITLRKIFTYTIDKNITIEKFPPVIKEPFTPDDDAVNLINAIDLIKWGKTKKLKLIKFEGAIMKGYLSYKLKNIPLINLLTGGVFLVFKK